MSRYWVSLKTSVLNDKLLFYFTTLQSACYLQIYPLLFIVSFWFWQPHANTLHQLGYDQTAPLQSHRCAVDF